MPPPAPNKRKAALELVWESEARFSRKKEVRARILEAAAGAFMERGYAATTLDDIAALLGNTKGQIYHYYRRKLDLYFDVAVGAPYMINASFGEPVAGDGTRPNNWLLQASPAISIENMPNPPSRLVAHATDQCHLNGSL